MEDLLKELIHEVQMLRADLTQPAAAQSAPKLVRLKDAVTVLGYDNYHQLYRKIKARHYRIGHEVSDRRNPGSSLPDYWLDLEKCRERDAVLPARRAK